ncbi:6-phosphogluconolactonase [Falsiphaeobacter marinintestinus]|uniref:6-phosphogluconolactonase n=1 Tax=Falsiphaeobacter marinintestinus TaxID=1492905 RepID=UPI0011B3F141|nr:6-phosphogluconolactonase [Phaeobacter marinintestinus]
MKLTEYADRDMLVIDVANTLAGELKSALLHQDTVSLAVPGGTTPGPVFDALCAADLDWDRVHVFPTDERWVPQDHPRSNAQLICSRLLVNRASTAQFLPLYAPAETPDEVLPGIEALLAPELPISVLLLGMGDDMHTASMFPGARGLAEALSPDARILSVLHPDNQPETRVSLSARVLDGAVSKHLVIFGAQKRTALERAMTLPPEDAPIQAVLSDLIVHWAE